MEAAEPGSASPPEIEIAIARENMDSLMETYLARSGTPGKFEIEKTTIHRVAPRKISALASLRAPTGKTARFARIDADFSGTAWRIERLKWLPASEAESLRGTFKLTSRTHALEDALRRKSPAARQDVPARIGVGGPLDVSLNSAAGSARVRLLDCPTPYCLTILVSPSCDLCMVGTDSIKKLMVFLRELGTTSRVVVASGESGSILEYAAEFGGEAYLDPRQELRLEGQPHFVVSDSVGNIRRKVVGLPPGHESPETFAKALGFPN